MTGCRYNAKNTLDKNYLYLAEKGGAEVLPEKRVIRVVPVDNQKNSAGEAGYKVLIKDASGLIKRRKELTARGVVFSGGVLGTVRLLLNMKKRFLPGLHSL